jgi:phosphonate transport system ATP-binding protein
MIRFESASVVYPGGVHALRGLSLEVPDGQMMVIVGLSGAGKSTLIRAINGLVPLTDGDVTIDGVSVRRAKPKQLREIRSRIGMIFQTFNLVKRTSVLNNVLMGRFHDAGTIRSLLGWYGKEDVEIAMQSLERVGIVEKAYVRAANLSGGQQQRVGIVEKAYVRAANLSGGQQQRVGIARALAQQPKIILADEPVASLDPPTSHVVMRDLQRINRELGITTIVNLHFLDLAKVYGQRIVGLRGGELVYDGTAAQADESVFRDIYGRSLTADDVMGEETRAAASG